MISFERNRHRWGPLVINHLSTRRATRNRPALGGAAADIPPLWNESIYSKTTELAVSRINGNGPYALRLAFLVTLNSNVFRLFSTVASRPDVSGFSYFDSITCGAGCSGSR